MMDAFSGTAATKGNLLSARRSLSLARMGYELMDRKQNILMREMTELMDRANDLRSRVDTVWRDAYQSLQTAGITLGLDVCESIAQAVPVETGINISLRSVMGAELPTVRMNIREPEICYDFTGSNAMFDRAFVSFHEVKRMLVDLAEIENSVFRLAVAIKKTRSRSNALKNIIIPNLERTVRTITDALEEKAREEFSRLKVIKRKKNRAL